MRCMLHPKRTQTAISQCIDRTRCCHVLFKEKLFPSVRFTKNARFYATNTKETKPFVSDAIEKPHGGLSWKTNKENREDVSKKLWIFNSQLAAYHKNGQVKGAIARLEKMITKHKSYNMSSFQIVLSLCSQQRDYVSALGVHQRMHQVSMLPSSAQMYSYLINTCIQPNSKQRTIEVDPKAEGFVMQAENYWQEMLDQNISPTSFVLGYLLKVYKRYPGHADKALELFHSYFHGDAANFQADSITTAIIIAILCREPNGRYGVQAFHILSKFLHFTPESRNSNSKHVLLEMHTYNYVLDALQRESQWYLFQNVLHMKAQLGPQNDKRTLQLLEKYYQKDPTPLHVSLRASYPKGADYQRKLKEWTAELVQLTRSDKEPPYTIALPTQKDWHLLCSRQPAIVVPKLAHYWSLYEAYRQRFDCHLPPDAMECNTQSLNSLLYAHARHGMLEKSLQLLEKMCQSRQANEKSFDTVLALCSRRQDLETARKVFSLLDASSLPIEPNIRCFNALLHCHTAPPKTIGNQLENALEIFYRIGNRANVVTLNTMLKVFQTNAPIAYNDSSFVTRGIQALEFYRLFSRISPSVIPEARTHFALFRCFVPPVERADTSEVDPVSLTILKEHMLNVLSELPIPGLTSGVFHAALDFSQRIGDVNYAFSVFDIFQARREGALQPNETTLTLLLSVCRKTENPDLGLNLLHHLLDGTITHDGALTIAVWNSAIHMCGELLRTDDAIALFEAVLTLGVLQPNVHTFEHTIQACAHVKWTNKAMEAAHKMSDKLGYTSATAWRHVLLSCVHSADLETALSVLKKTKKDRKSYHLVLQAATEALRMGNHDELWIRDTIEALYQEMASQATPATVILMCRFYQVAKDPHAITQVVERFQSEGRTIDEWTTIAYLRACVASDNLNGVNQMLSKPDPPHSCAVLIEIFDALHHLNVWDVALKLFRKLSSQERSKFPDIDTETSLHLLEKVLAMCNENEEFAIVTAMFQAIRHSLEHYGSVITQERYFVDRLSAEAYIEAIFAAEAADNWVDATTLFMEMQQRYPEILTSGLCEKIALGRYQSRNDSS
uniref:Uncharacterized protein AlNc14C18G1916 n=1 Tax=Albugo laibachii Nc14 TaxID=890382 RepID=F0W4U6_9STRA|nr:conserved hypothetical protein [Albugo laibachii Nc14]CCA25095.1 conserved hypothetical protein [Albugo laibachii Nc14]|eukprot:CCA25095.1 conserved hypothetical protein [Albugo laibachii Nc14]